jgi:hypothetical protein
MIFAFAEPMKWNKNSTGPYNKAGALGNHPDAISLVMAIMHSLSA